MLRQSYTQQQRCTSYKLSCLPLKYDFLRLLLICQKIYGVIMNPQILQVAPLRGAAASARGVCGRLGGAPGEVSGPLAPHDLWYDHPATSRDQAESLPLEVSCSVQIGRPCRIRQGDALARRRASRGCRPDAAIRRDPSRDAGIPDAQPIHRGCARDLSAAAAATAVAAAAVSRPILQGCASSQPAALTCSGCAPSRPRAAAAERRGLGRVLGRRAGCSRGWGADAPAACAPAAGCCCSCCRATGSE